MAINYFLINREIAEVAEGFMDNDFSDDVVYRGDSISELKKKATNYSLGELTVVSYAPYFVTMYGYSTWVKKFGRN